MRKGYALTMILLTFVIVSAITYSAMFDAAKPRIGKALENTEKLSAGLAEIKDSLNLLWMKESLPSVASMTLSEFSTYTGRKFSLSYFKGLKDFQIKFVDVPYGKNVIIKCVLYNSVEIYPTKLSGTTVKGKEVSMTLRYRRGNAL